LIKNLEVYLGIKINLLQGAENSSEDPFDHFLQMYGGFLPSSNARWCTKKLKLDPFENYVGTDPVVSYVGIRGDEEREGYISTKKNIQSIFPFRKNIWSKDVVTKMLSNQNMEQLLTMSKNIDFGQNQEKTFQTISRKVNPSFTLDQKLNILLDSNVKAFKDGKVHRESNEVFWRKDGSSFPVEYVSTPIWDDGELVGAVVSFRDISARVALEAELIESKDRERILQSDLQHVSRVSAMGEVASAMAHELNQPLTAVMNYVQASRRLLSSETETATEKSTEKALGYMEKAVEQAARAGGIIRGLRKFVEKEDTERSFENINEIIEEAITLVLPGGQSNSIKFATKLSPDLPEILVHKVRLQQVIVNLVRNALEALEGRDDPQMYVKTHWRGDTFVEVCVCDNGPGLPSKVVQKLFQSFITTKPNGMGVGLSICKTIIEEHGGEIEAVDNKHGGTTFCFTLPITSQPETHTRMETDNA
ncbi:MAG: hypothetical protein COA69_05540, partial [Robiginitomaculum sp.]